MPRPCFYFISHHREPDLKRTKAIVSAPGVLQFLLLAERSKDPSMVAALTAVGDIVNTPTKLYDEDELIGLRVPLATTATAATP